ncbi:MAG: GDSL-type esterase/lipase family protein [Gammaproteobacteria bacterium]
MRFLTVVATCVALAGCSDAPQYEPLPAGTVVLAFGDSVTHGTGARDGEDYPTHLAQLTGWEVINAGIPGDTAKRAANRIHDELARIRPVVAIIELGGNDFLRRRPQSLVKEDLRTIINATRAAGAIPVLVAVPGASLFGAATGSLSDAPIYAELADEERVLLIDDVFVDVLSDDALRADRIHPNAAGYRVFATGVADALARAGLVTR